MQETVFEAAGFVWHRSLTWEPRWLRVERDFHTSHHQLVHYRLDDDQFGRPTISNVQAVPLSEYETLVKRGAPLENRHLVLEIHTSSHREVFATDDIEVDRRFVNALRAASVLVDKGVHTAPDPNSSSSSPSSSASSSSSSVYAFPKQLQSPHHVSRFSRDRYQKMSAPGDGDADGEQQPQQPQPGSTPSSPRAAGTPRYTPHPPATPPAVATPAANGADANSKRTRPARRRALSARERLGKMQRANTSPASPNNGGGVAMRASNPSVSLHRAKLTRVQSPPAGSGGVGGAPQRSPTPMLRAASSAVLTRPPVTNATAINGAGGSSASSISTKRPAQLRLARNRSLSKQRRSTLTLRVATSPSSHAISRTPNSINSHSRSHSKSPSTSSIRTHLLTINPHAKLVSTGGSPTPSPPTDTALTPTAASASVAAVSVSASPMSSAKTPHRPVLRASKSTVSAPRDESSADASADSSPLGSSNKMAMSGVVSAADRLPVSCRVGAPQQNGRENFLDFLHEGHQMQIGSSPRAPNESPRNRKRPSVNGVPGLFRSQSSAILDKNAMSDDIPTRARANTDATIVAPPKAHKSTPSFSRVVALTNKEIAVRENVVTEIRSTEIEYCKALATLKDRFADPLKADGILNDEEHRKIFSSLLKIQRLHEDILEALLSGTKIVSMVITDNCNEFFLHYSPFVNEYERVMKLVEKLQSKKSKFAAFIDKRKDRHDEDFESLLITPVQRLPRYELLFRELLKHTPEHHPEHDSVFNTHKAISDINRYVNEAKRNAENFDKIINIQHLVQAAEHKSSKKRKFTIATGECSRVQKTPTILLPGRVFIRSAKFQYRMVSTELSSNGATTLSKMRKGVGYLFNDMLMWCSSSSNEFQGYCELATSHITPQPTMLKVPQLGFQINDDTQPFLLLVQCEAAQDVAQWIRAIQREQDKEKRRQETAADAQREKAPASLPRPVTLPSIQQRSPRDQQQPAVAAAEQQPAAAAAAAADSSSNSSQLLHRHLQQQNEAGSGHTKSNPSMSSEASTQSTASSNASSMHSHSESFSGSHSRQRSSSGNSSPVATLTRSNSDNLATTPRHSHSDTRDSLYSTESMYSTSAASTTSMAAGTGGVGGGVVGVPTTITLSAIASGQQAMPPAPVSAPSSASVSVSAPSSSSPVTSPPTSSGSSRRSRNSLKHRLSWGVNGPKKRSPMNARSKSRSLSRSRSNEHENRSRSGGGLFGGGRSHSHHHSHEVPAAVSPPAVTPVPANLPRKAASMLFGAPRKTASSLFEVPSAEKPQSSGDEQRQLPPVPQGRFPPPPPRGSAEHQQPPRRPPLSAPQTPMPAGRRRSRSPSPSGGGSSRSLAVAAAEERGRRESRSRSLSDEDEKNRKDLADLFERLGLDSSFLQAFYDQSITVADIPNLTEADLAWLIPLLGPRSRLRKFVTFITEIAPSMSPDDQSPPQMPAPTPPPPPSIEPPPRVAKSVSPPASARRRNSAVSQLKESKLPPSPYDSIRSASVTAADFDLPLPAPLPQQPASSQSPPLPPSLSTANGNADPEATAATTPRTIRRAAVEDSSAAGPPDFVHPTTPSAARMSRPGLPNSWSHRQGGSAATPSPQPSPPASAAAAAATDDPAAAAVPVGSYLDFGAMRGTLGRSAGGGMAALKKVAEDGEASAAAEATPPPLVCQCGACDGFREHMWSPAVCSNCYHNKSHHHHEC